MERWGCRARHWSEHPISVRVLAIPSPPRLSVTGRLLAYMAAAAERCLTVLAPHAPQFTASCALLRNPSAAPVAAPPGELLVQLHALHVGAPHPDDGTPGVPLARRHLLIEQTRAQFRAATLVQARMRGQLKREQARKRLGTLSTVKGVAEHAAMTNAGGVPCLCMHRCLRFVCSPCLSLLDLLCCCRCCFGPTREGKGDGGPLLPVSGLAQQEAIAASWQRRRLLLRTMLLLLALICVACLAAAGVVLLLLGHAQRAEQGLP